MARTTLNLDPSVMAELRRRSAGEGKPIGTIASQLLAQALATPREAPSRSFSWISADLGRPAVDLDDKDALHDLLDE